MHTPKDPWYTGVVLDFVNGHQVEMRVYLAPSVALEVRVTLDGVPEQAPLRTLQSWVNTHGSTVRLRARRFHQGGAIVGVLGEITNTASSSSLNAHQQRAASAD